MKDLTNGSIARHVLTMAAPLAAGMVIQMAYQMIDLYFVSGLGDAAVAGVSAAGNLAFVVLAATQVLGVGTVALIAHAVGRNDRPDANLVFNQSFALSVLCVAMTMVIGYLLKRFYLESVAADAATIEAGNSYLSWFIPCLAMQFAVVTMGSALRGTGIVQPTMIIQMLTVLINAILAPVLIAGWGTGHPLGVAGAGLASTIAIVIGVAMLAVYFVRLDHYVGFDRALMRPQLAQWKRMFALGLPAGGEFAMIFLYTAITYYAIRGFGTAAQAGYGIGGRVMQAIMLPAMAVALAASPIAGQNVGARNGARVKQAFRASVVIGSTAMLALTIFAQWRPEAFISVFTKEPEALRVGAVFLRLLSWNFVAQGLIFTCSSMFQALGNTRPSLLSSCTRLVTYAVPVVWLSTQASFHIEQVWYLSIATVTLQALVSLSLLRMELAKRLPGASGPAPARAPVSA